LEPFITPSIYQKYPGAIDEWTLHTLMAADKAGGGINQLEDHYKTFIVRSLSFAHPSEFIFEYLHYLRPRRILLK
jgi:hypothetical protein